MMKLRFALTLIFALFSAAGALQCNICANTQCSTIISVTCPNGTMCATASALITTSPGSVQQVFKLCALSELCPSTGRQTFSASLGIISTLATVDCCDTDNCNSNTLPFPSFGADNDLRCLTCNISSNMCDLPLRCRGPEDRCLQVNVTVGSTSAPVFGCATLNVCSAISSLNTIPEVANIGNITDAACCGTNLCVARNAALGATTSSFTPLRLGLIHLLLGLIKFILY